MFLWIHLSTIVWSWIPKSPEELSPERALNPGDAKNPKIPVL
jgi:hypothetical protein